MGQIRQLARSKAAGAASQRRPGTPFARRPIMESLEPRLLLSADLNPLPLLSVDSVLATPIAGEFRGITEIPSVPKIEFAAIAPEMVKRTHEIVFVDASTPDFKRLLDDIRANGADTRDIEVVALYGGGDGIKQITNALAQRKDVDAIHIISHGSPGEVQLGTATLDFDSLLKQGKDLKNWGKALGEHGDIFFYGCNLAGNDEGKSLMDAIARLTGADVAASEDLTGATAKGGDWDLEYSTGAIEASIVVSMLGQIDWGHTLDAPVAVNDAYATNEDTPLVVAPSTANLTNWWRFDEGGSGQTTASAGSLGSSGTLGSTGSPDTADPAWTTGYVGAGALSFNGGDYVASTSTELKTATTFTLSAWFQTSSTTTTQHILWQGYAGGNGYGNGGSTTAATSEMSLTIGGYNATFANKIVFSLGYDVPANGANSIFIVSTSDFTDTTSWHHVAVTVTDIGGGVMLASLYVDGRLEGADTGTQNDRTVWQALRIGAAGDGSRSFNGQIDEVRIYGSELSAAQVQGIVHAGVLANDTDADDPQFRVKTPVVTGPSNGTLSINADGSFTYTPNANFDGTDSFAYRANDDSADSNVATVTITVNPVADAPTLTLSNAATNEDTSVALTLSATSPDADETVSVTLDGVPAGASFNQGTNNGGGSWSFTQAQLGGLQFTPPVDFAGGINLSATATSNDDGQTATSAAQTLTVTVSPVNDAPVAVVDGYMVAEDATLTQPSGAWDAAMLAWAYRTQVSIANIGAGVLTDFPVLVKIETATLGANFYSQSKAGGADLRFVDPDGTPLPHEIESWNPGGVSYVWVKVPQFDASSGTDFIRMYWGNAAALDNQNTDAVWNASYVGVWHLNGSAADSSGTGNNGALNGTTAAPGIVGGARDFDGVDDWISVASNASLQLTVAMTLEGWVQMDGFGAGTDVDAILRKGEANPNNYQLALLDQKAYFVLDGSDDGTSLAGTTNLTASPAWHYVVATWDGATQRIYVDGTLQGSVARAAPVGTDLRPLYIGGRAGEDLVIGRIDEARISNSARSAGWIAAQYAAVTGGLLTPGTVQGRPAAGVLANDTDTDGDALTAVLDTNATRGNVTLNPDGSFTYSLNAAGADYSGTDSFTYRAFDGSLYSAIRTVTITITPVADVADDGTTTLEDNSVTLNVLTNDSFENAGRTVTAVGTAANGSVAIVDGAAGTVQYTPNANFNGVDSFTYTVTSGGVTETATVTVTVTPANDAPVIADLNGDVRSYAAGSGAVIIDQGAGATVTDVDSTDFDGGNLMVTIAAGEDAAEDVLAINTGAGVTLSSGMTVGSTISVGGIAIGMITSDGSGGMDLGVSFNASATPVRIQTLVRSITYQNTDANSPTPGNRTVRYTAHDGDGATSAVTDVTIAVKPVVSIVATDAAAAEPADNGRFTVTLSAASATDTVIAYTTGGTANNGSDYALLSGSVTLLAGATTAFIDITTTNDSIVEANETVIVTLSSITSGDADVRINGMANSATVIVTDDDTTPSIADATVAVPENPAAATLVIELNDVLTGNDTDLDGDPLSYSILAGNGSGAFAINSATGQIVVANALPLDFETTPTFILTIQATDGTNPDTATITIDLQNVNEAPVLTVPGAQTAAEDTPLVLSGASAITIADVDGTAPQVTLTAANGFLTLAGTAGLTLTLGDGVGDVTMSFTGSMAALNAALDGLEFLPSFNFSGAASIAIAIDDLGQTGAGGPQTAGSAVAINVTAVNDAPVGAADAYTIAEDGALIVGPAAGVLANDTDVDGPTAAAVLVSAPANGVLTLSADGSFTYVPNPDFVGVDSFAYQASDGALQSAPTTVTLNVTAVNDAPMNTVPGAQTVSEDRPLVFSAAGGNAISVTDSDAGTNHVRVTLSATNGTLTLGGASGLAFAVGDGVTDSTIVVTGTLADINAALSALLFQPDANYHGSANVQIVTEDQGASGSGGGAAAATSIAINVTPVNDVPELGNNTLKMERDGTVVFGSANLSATDVDDAADSLVFNVEALANGRFERVSAPGIAVTRFTQGDILGGAIRFIHTGGEAPSYRIHVSDAAESSGPYAATIVYTGGSALLAGGGGDGGDGGDGGTVLEPSDRLPTTSEPPTVDVPTAESFLRPPNVPPVEETIPDPAPAARDGESDGVNKETVAALDPKELPPGADTRFDRVPVSDQIVEFDDLTPVSSLPLRKDPIEIISRPAVLEMPEDGEERRLEIVLDSVRISGLALSVGAVWWALRATGLIASLLASAPAWRHIDPLPVLGRGDDDEVDEDVEWGDAEDAESKRDEQAAGWVLEDNPTVVREVK